MNSDCESSEKANRIDKLITMKWIVDAAAAGKAGDSMPAVAILLQIALRTAENLGKHRINNWAEKITI